jgi:hypothetical protein
MEAAMLPTPLLMPWAWRDPSILTQVEGAGEPGDETADSASADRQAHADLSGYKVEAIDGRIGSIDEASYDVDAAYLVVDTGVWIFGRKVLLPAGTVQRVEHDERIVYVDRTKEQIKDSPEFDASTFHTPEYRERVGGYYSDSYRNWPTVG